MLNSVTRFPLAAVSILLLATGVLLFAAGTRPSDTTSGAPSGGPTPAAASRESGAADLVRDLPLHFQANRGQTNPAVAFLSRGSGYSVYFTENEAVLQLTRPLARPSAGDSEPLGPPAKAFSAPEPASYAVNVLRMQFEGASPDLEVTGQGLLPGKFNYLLGDDPRAWRTNVPHYSRVRYSSVYPGIDLVFYGEAGRLRYDFIVSPWSDPRLISLRFQGAESLELDAGGDLLLHVADGVIRQEKPVVYQEAEGVRREVQGEFQLKDDDLVAFQMGPYDRSLPLIIDPPLVFSTFLGGIGGDAAFDVAVDASGNVYLAGRTSSHDFPVAGPFQSTCGGGVNDAFIAKFNPSGSELIYATYLGGAGSDYASGISVDASGSAYVAGYTRSPNFPSSKSFLPDDSVNPYPREAFVAKLDPTGSDLEYSTLIGGSSLDVARGIAVDVQGNAHVTGFTFSDDFPTIKAIQTSRGGSSDAFVSKLNPSGDALIYSTYLGGRESDGGWAVSSDKLGNTYVAGSAESVDFPTTDKKGCGTFKGFDLTCPFQSSNGGRYDAFVAKLDPLGTSLTYSTYLGGDSYEEGRGIAVDDSGSVYVTGYTGSDDFPTSEGAVQTNRKGPATGALRYDGFVTKLTPDGSDLAYSTYLGGSSRETGLDVGVDSAGNAYVTGYTSSADFPSVNAVQSAYGGGGIGLFATGDAFVVQLNPSGTALRYSTYLGGEGDDMGMGIAADPLGNVWVAGRALSADFPTTSGAFQETFADGGTLCPFTGVCPDAFVIKLGPQPIVFDLELKKNAGPVVPTPTPTRSLPDTIEAGSKPDRFIVIFKDEVDDPEAMTAELGPKREFALGHLFRGRIKGFSAKLLASEAEKLRLDPRVAFVERDQIVTVVDDGGQHTPTGVRRIQADLNPLVGIDGSDERVDIDIAIIDTGIDFDHPDLNVVRGVNCAKDGPCTDGFVDDCNGHGTHVAGTAAALDNGIGVVGVAPGGRLWEVKVLSDTGSGWISWIIAGIEWVTDHAGEIDVANMSLGCECESEALDAALADSIDQGVVYAVAAGNAGKDAAIFSPANHPGVITVSAITDFEGEPGGFASATCRLFDDDDSLAPYSNWGSLIDIAAPGSCILSTYAGGIYATLSGTSMASPHVAGAAGLYIAVNGRDRNGDGAIDKSDVDSIRSAIVGAAIPQDSPCGFTAEFTYRPDFFSDEPLLYVSGPAFGGSGGTCFADLDLTMAASAKARFLDRPPAATVTARNLGPDPARDVTLTMAISRGATIASVEPPVCGLISVLSSRKLLTCDLGKIPAGVSSSLTVALESDGSADETSLIAHIDGQPFDPDPSNNDATVTIGPAAESPASQAGAYIPAPEEVAVEVSSSDSGTFADVTIELPSACHGVSDWGTAVRTAGGVIVANLILSGPEPGQECPREITAASRTYGLGTLEEGVRSLVLSVDGVPVRVIPLRRPGAGVAKLSFDPGLVRARPGQEITLAVKIDHFSGQRTLGSLHLAYPKDVLDLLSYVPGGLFDAKATLEEYRGEATGTLTMDLFGTVTSLDPDPFVALAAVAPASPPRMMFGERSLSLLPAEDQSADSPEPLSSTAAQRLERLVGSEAESLKLVATSRSIRQPVEGSGTVMVVRFRVKESAPSGVHTVALEGSGASIGEIASATIEVVDALAGDVNGDGAVDVRDLAMLAAAFGTRAGGARFRTAADLNGDGAVDSIDLGILGANYGQIP